MDQGRAKGKLLTVNGRIVNYVLSAGTVRLRRPRRVLAAQT